MRFLLAMFLLIKCVNAKEHIVTRTEILANKHAVVRFTATWCGPCKTVAPVFDELAKENPSVVTYVIDVDNFHDLAKEFNVKGIPTMLVIRDNVEAERLVGNQPKPELEKMFK